MRTVLTGATGYIGRHLLAAILERGWHVCAVVQPLDETPLPAAVARVPDPGSAADLAVALATFRPDVVMHLAACQDLTDMPEASDSLIEANLDFGARALSAAHAAGARAFVAAGTYSAHVTGTAEYAPQTLYAATKQAFLSIGEYYRRNTPLRTVMLELSDTYGPGDARPKFLNLVASAAASGETLEASPGDQQVRPLHVDDIVEAFIHAATLILEGAELDAVYSVAGPQAVTLRELVDEFERATRRPVPIRWGARSYRVREIMRPWAGNPLPSWQPRIGLAVGLRGVYERPSGEEKHADD